MGHGHSHARRPVDLQVPVRLRRMLTLAVLPVVIVTAIALVVLWPRGAGPNLGSLFGGDQHLVKASVEAVTVSPCLGSPEGGDDRCQHLRVRILEGRDHGKRINLETGAGSTGPTVSKGDHLVLGYSGGGDRQYYFADFDRDVPILLLVLLFAAASIVFGRWSGVRALLALVVSLLALVWFVIPSVLHGHSPLAVSLAGAAFIMIVVLYVTGGLNTQTTVAVLGTMLSLALIVALAWVFVEVSHLTGLADEDAVFLQTASTAVNIRGLLLGGIIIGSLGVLDDMTVTQVSSVWELRRADPTMPVRELYRSAERIGRDHIASTVNTLVLAYAGASLPLLIFFTQSNLHLTQILTSEVIATEVIRTLVGSIGLIASVPITTALAAFVVTRGDDHRAR